MNAEWQDDDEVVTTYRTIKMMQQEAFEAGVAFAQSQAKV